MQLIHITSGLSCYSGGPSVVVPTLCTNLKAIGCNVKIVTIKSEFSDAALKCEKEGVDLCSYHGIRLGRMPFSKDFSKDLPKIINSGDIYHVNGLWDYTIFLAYRELVKQNKPFIISFHGSITNQKHNWRLKHHIAWKTFLYQYVSKASCLHACTVEEYKSIRKIGLKNPVAIIPYGFDQWEPLSSNTINKIIPEMQNWKTVLYLGRIHPKKGIYDLIDAWSMLAESCKDWKLVIAGPGRQDHINKMLHLIKTNKINSRVSFIGPLYDIKKRAAYQGCDLFVAPSYSENFGLTVGEALACGKPVIVTDGVPWPELPDCNCGWNVRCGIPGLVSGLREALKANDKELTEMGRRGKLLINSNYNWASLSKHMISVYEWILNKNTLPACVHVN